MPFIDAIRLALATIRVQKLKSFFTLPGVTIGVMLLIAVVSIVEAMGRYSGCTPGRAARAARLDPVEALRFE